MAHLAKTRLKLRFGSLTVSRNSSALQGTKHADKHAMFKPHSPGRVHYKKAS